MGESVRPFIYKDLADADDEITVPAGKYYPYEHLEHAQKLEARQEHSSRQPTMRPPRHDTAPSSATHSSIFRPFQDMWIAIGGASNKDK
jgi:hypothetical protein